MTPELQRALESLSPTQRQGVEWDQGSALVLAGPGVGKTTVLTTRIARILDSSRKQHFRILALTFTTKAGDEMRKRVEDMVPGLVERTVIGTFHSFCTHVLRQHGSHLGIKPDFGIYDQKDDRVELLYEALDQAASEGEPVTTEDVGWINAIDRLRSNLVSPEKTAKHFYDAAAGEKASRVYAIYENALRVHNVTDFNGMILDTCRLAVRVPAVAARIRQSYPYWMIDEFQDTTPAQYRLVRFLAGAEFKNVFAVADDDQIIYEWAGASYRQITAFREHFSPELLQLVENRRCPFTVVQAANNLISHNAERTPGKMQLVAMKPNAGQAIEIRVFATEEDEANAVASEIGSLASKDLSSTAVLGRTRAVLQPVLEACINNGVPASIATRRDRFVSSQFLWLQSCLELVVRPTNRQMFTTMVGAANRMGYTELDAAILAAGAESSGFSYLEFWVAAAKRVDSEIGNHLAKFADRLVQSRSDWWQVVADALDWLPTTIFSVEGVVNDVDEDKAAWINATEAIKAELGKRPDLVELLQGIALRPKEPPVDPNSVRLLTIHAAKGLEFDRVWIVGVAESILPVWQSLKPEAKPAELEEERRSFFVAITRTRNRLILSHANKYKGWVRDASRFIDEMDLPKV